MWKTVQEGLLLKRAFHLTQNSIYMPFQALQDVTEVAAPTSQRTPCLSPRTGFVLSAEETKRVSFQTQGVCTCCPAAPSARPRPSNPPPQKGHGLSPCSPATPCDVTLCSYLKFFSSCMSVLIFILDSPCTHTHQHTHCKFHAGAAICPSYRPTTVPRMW